MCSACLPNLNQFGLSVLQKDQSQLMPKIQSCLFCPKFKFAYSGHTEVTVIAKYCLATFRMNFKKIVIFMKYDSLYSIDLAF